MVTGVEQIKEMPSVETKADSRKNNKPIMEKRRRARINNCLNELKVLILDAMKKDPASHSKLEKADILEMTVKHLEGLQSSGFADRFRSGYRHCLSEVVRFPGLEPELRARLLRHLEESMPGARPVRPPAAPTPPSDAEDAPHSALISVDPNTLRRLPTRLSNGDLALLLATNANDQGLPARFQSDVKWYLPPASSDVPLVTQSIIGASALEGPALIVPPVIEPCFSPASFENSLPGVCAKALEASNPVLLRDRPSLSPAKPDWSTPTPAELCPLALVTKTEDRPWRPW